MSFMDGKNILTEGFFDALKKLFTRSKLTKQEKQLLKDPKLKKLYNDAMKNAKEAGKGFDDLIKKQKAKRIKPKHYK